MASPKLGRLASLPARRGYPSLKCVEIAQVKVHAIFGAIFGRKSSNIRPSSREDWQRKIRFPPRLQAVSGGRGCSRRSEVSTIMSSLRHFSRLLAFCHAALKSRNHACLFSIHFPDLTAFAAALKSRTAAHKTRTKFLLKFVRG